MSSWHKKEQAEAAYNALWNRRSQALEGKINSVPESRYVIDVDLKYLTQSFQRYAQDYDGFDYNPDFQRGHVWTQDHQIKYMEAMVRGTLGVHAKTITLNCPDFHNNLRPDSDLKGFVIVDGLQRVTAIQAYLAGDFKIFGDITQEDLVDSKFSLRRKTLKIQIFDFQTKAELLKYYLAFNDGGVVHSREEILRVQEMLKGLGD